MHPFIYLLCSLDIFCLSDLVTCESILHECFRLIPLVKDFSLASVQRITAFLLLWCKSIIRSITCMYHLLQSQRKEGFGFPRTVFSDTPSGTPLLRSAKHVLCLILEVEISSPQSQIDCQDEKGKFSQYSSCFKLPIPQFCKQIKIEVAELFMDLEFNIQHRKNGNIWRNEYLQKEICECTNCKSLNFMYALSFSPLTEMGT